MSITLDAEQVKDPRDVLRRAGLIGSGTGALGLTYGAIRGTLTSQTPILFSLVSGAQCFMLGSTFWTIRSTILSQTQLRNWWNSTRGVPLLPLPDQPTSKDRMRASVISGAATGFSLGFVFRGPQNVIPGTMCWAFFAWAGQRGYNMLDERNSESVKMNEEREAGLREPKIPLMQRMARSKWSPATFMTHEEYEKLLGEKLLGMEADIALIDDKIAALRAQQKELDAQKAKARAEETK